MEDKEQDEPETSGRRMDPEIKVMSAILRTLDELDETAKDRVVAWLSSRYESGK